MANVYKLYMKFKNSEGKTVTHSLANAASAITGTAAKAIMQAYITNSTLFKDAPVSIESCYLNQSSNTGIEIPAD